MDFSFSANFITGMMLGMEFVSDEDERYVVFDFLIIRLVFGYAVTE